MKSRPGIYLLKKMREKKGVFNNYGLPTSINNKIIKFTDPRSFLPATIRIQLHGKISMIQLFLMQQ